MLLGRSAPGEKWSRRDTLYALALTQYEQGLCGGCGMPLSMTTADEASGRKPHGYGVGHFVCSGCEELEQAQASAEKAGEKVEPGKKTFLYLDD